MDRPASLIDAGTAAAVRIAAVLLVACASTPRPQVVARGTLAYAVAAAGTELVSIELDERFALLVRPADSGGDDPPPPRLRVDLGPAELDLPALAVVGARAYVGGDDQAVRRIDLVSGRITARWPVGAAVTALAASADLVAIGDASGVLCLRRAGDGALLQCVVASREPISDLTLVGDVLITSAGASTDGWRLPSLAASGPARRRRPVWADGEVVFRGRTVELVAAGRRRQLAVMDGQVRAIAVLPGRRLAIAAWIGRLDNPSIIVLAPLD